MAGGVTLKSPRLSVRSSGGGHRQLGIVGKAEAANQVTEQLRQMKCAVVIVEHGLDEKAIEAVQSWKFAPALEQGIPVESKMAVEISFRSK
jgi:hypothetical protein